MIRRRTPSRALPGLELGVEFNLPVSDRRDSLIAKLFTEGLDNSCHTRDAWSVTWRMIARIARSDTVRAVPADPRGPVPAWLTALAAEDRRPAKDVAHAA